MNLSVKNPELLKIFAVLLMASDHIGAMLNDNILLRSLGRFALPLFIFQLVNGFISTKNENTNFKYLFIFSLISYFPYNIFIYGDYLHNLVNDFEIKGTWNVFLPLTIAYFCLILFKNNNKTALYLMLLISMFIDMDYDWFIPLMSVISYRIISSNQTPNMKWVSLFLSYFFLNLIYSIQTNAIWIQLIAPLGIPLAWCLMNVNINIRLPKMFYYWFYPVHLVILSFCKVLI